MTNSKPIIPGSIKNKIVASDLLAERANCDFNQAALREILYQGPSEIARIDSIVEDFNKDPVLRSSEKFYELTRAEQQELLLKKMRHLYDNYRDKYFTNFKPFFVPWFAVGIQGVLPFGLTYTMFYLTVAHLADED